tara:strand:+ start:221 stop:427 length:207 start_codon:yes stop_codon:yes gene_type:complete
LVETSLSGVIGVRTFSLEILLVNWIGRFSVVEYVEARSPKVPFSSGIFSTWMSRFYDVRLGGPLIRSN